jgi:hypothetical protein
MLPCLHSTFNKLPEFQKIVVVYVVLGLKLSDRLIPSTNFE